MEQREMILQELQTRKLFPQIYQDDLEKEAGLYPDLDDPRFLEKLLVKKEFAENLQPSIAEQAEEGVNPCDPEQEFELTPVQRFNARFLSPQCP